MSTGRYPDLPSRLPLFLDRDHFRSCLKPRGSIPQVDYHALISERENRHLGRLFLSGIVVGKRSLYLPWHTTLPLRKGWQVSPFTFGRLSRRPGCDGSDFAWCAAQSEL